MVNTVKYPVYHISPIQLLSITPRRKSCWSYQEGKRELKAEADKVIPGLCQDSWLWAAQRLSLSSGEEGTMTERHAATIQITSSWAKLGSQRERKVLTPVSISFKFPWTQRCCQVAEEVNQVLPTYSKLWMHYSETNKNNRIQITMIHCRRSLKLVHFCKQDNKTNTLYMRIIKEKIKIALLYIIVIHQTTHTKTKA